jgi:hypothetical protein
VGQAGDLNIVTKGRTEVDQATGAPLNAPERRCWISIAPLGWFGQLRDVHEDVCLFRRHAANEIGGFPLP